MARMLFLKKTLYVVAEVANAAQGVVEDNYRIIDAVAGAGANAIKFQLYKFDELATPSYEKYEVFKRTFYGFEERSGFIEQANRSGLDVWVDIFDRWGLDLARENRDKIVAVKIPPTVILDNELVEQILGLNCPTAVGVGGYEDEDIDFVLSQLKGHHNEILLMYGFQGFPTPEEDTSLSRIGYLKDKYSYPIGFADHVDADSEMAFRMPEYAFFAGASVIEKHITLDRAAKGLDYYSSLEPHEFKKMVGNLKRCVRIHGTAQISNIQKDYLVHATRATTVRSVKAGDLLFRKDVKLRRTDNSKALFPTEMNDYLPGVVLQDIGKDAGVSNKDVRKAIAGVIVVCRLNSKRLPRKALVDLGGVSAIERCLLNTLASRRSSMTILATSTHPEDEALREHTLNGKVEFLQGSEDDPAARMLEAADQYGLDFIVRVTGDSPLISYELIDVLLDSHFSTGADFSYLKNAPMGVRPEVISKQAIKRLKSMTNTDGYSEYLTLYFKNNPEFFHLNEVIPPVQYRFPQYRLNLDYPEDLEVLRAIFDRLKVGCYALPLSQALDFLTNHPEVAGINASVKPKYQDSDLAEQLNKVTKIRK